MACFFWVEPHGLLDACPPGRDAKTDGALCRLTSRSAATGVPVLPTTVRLSGNIHAAAGGQPPTAGGTALWPSVIYAAPDAEACLPPGAPCCRQRRARPDSRRHSLCRMPSAPDRYILRQFAGAGHRPACMGAAPPKHGCFDMQLTPVKR